jgi:hypothetical protein
MGDWETTPPKELMAMIDVEKYARRLGVALDFIF